MESFLEIVQDRRIVGILGQRRVGGSGGLAVGGGDASPGNRILFVLREHDHCVWPDADSAGAGQSVGSLLLGFDLRGGMIGKI